MRHIRRWPLALATIFLSFSLPRASFAEDFFRWNTNSSKVTADIRSTDLFRVLKAISASTGWKVYVEPETAHRVSAKFKDLPPGQALHILLGDVNFAFIPDTNSQPRLYVFRTTASRATELMQPAEMARAAAAARKIPGELIVRLKPGANIADIAKAIGAKVIGRIDSLNAYRLQLGDINDEDTARAALADNADVLSLENNLAIDGPPPSTMPGGGGVPALPSFQLRPPNGDGTVIGVVDTAYQSLGKDLDAMVLKQLYAAGQPDLDPNVPSHGTMVVETIMQSLQNYAPAGGTSVRILPVDIYGSNPDTSSFAAAAGIAMAVNNGANIINMSFGGVGDSQVMHDVISDAYSKGIIFIAAAGNDGSGENFYPAAYPEVWSVTAVDNGKLDSYANWGPFVDFAASGNGAINFNGQGWYARGTSISSPYVTGALGGLTDTSPRPTMLQSRTALGNIFGFTPPSALPPPPAK